MYILGLDYSISLASLCAYDTEKDKYEITSWCGDTYKRYARERTKVGNFTFECVRVENKHHFYHAQAESIFDKIKSYKDGVMGIEDFAYGAVGKVINLGEQVGKIKYLYYKKFNKEIIKIPISHGKMCVNEAHRGDVGKYTNIEYFIKNLTPKLLDKMNLKIEDINPLSDWVDSYGICKFVYYLNEYSYGRKKDIPDKILKTIEKNIDFYKEEDNEELI